MRLMIGGQGDTLANMVNTYWICRYRAKDENRDGVRDLKSVSGIRIGFKSNSTSGN